MAEDVKETKEKFQLSPKAKKILNIVVDVIVAIVLVFAVFLAVVSISSKSKGYGSYTEIFGTAYVAVASDSMDADPPADLPAGKLSGFAKGDLIKIKTLKQSEASKLEVGDIITFKTNQILEGKYVLNTHRIVAINTGSEGNASSYITKGDNNLANDSGFVMISDIVGVYQGKAPGIGHVFLFMGSTTGFFVCIVLPTLLIVVYCAVNLVLVIRKEKKVQTAEAEEASAKEKEEERERIRQELLAEMQAQSQSQPEPKSEEKAEVKAEEKEETKSEEKKEQKEETKPEQKEEPKE
ncbi:MAG: signal peptidase I [Candidatus Coproplasma sp.]